MAYDALKKEGKRGLDRIQGMGTDDLRAKAAINAFKTLTPAQKRTAINRGFVDVPIGGIDFDKQMSPSQRHRQEVKEKKRPGHTAVFRRVWVSREDLSFAGRGVYVAQASGHAHTFGAKSL